MAANSCLFILSTYPFPKTRVLTTTGNAYSMGNSNYVYPITPQAYDPTIRWETTVTYNAGIDYGFFDDRLSGSVDAYISDTKDLLNSVQVPMGASFGNKLTTNVGSIRNKGLEFSINATARFSIDKG